MAIRKKGTRKIAVDGVVYRWVVAPDDEPGLAMVVKHFEHPAQRLVSWVDHGVIITPKLVRAAIKDALELGWQPLEKGVDFKRRNPAFSQDADELLLPCPCCDYLTIDSSGDYEICPVCFWEDAGERDLDVHSGPNHMTVRQGRENFAKFGACDEASIKKVLSVEKRTAVTTNA